MDTYPSLDLTCEFEIMQHIFRITKSPPKNKMKAKFWSTTSFLLLLLLSLLEYSIGYYHDLVFFQQQDVVYKRNGKHDTNISRVGRNLLQDGVTVLPRPNLNVSDILLELDDSKNTNYGVYTNDELSNTPTLTKFHYMILPIWWSDINTSDPTFLMDAQSINPTLEQVKLYYEQMSFGLFELDWTILDQAVLPVASTNPSFDETENSARSLLNSKGFVDGTDFDGIMLLYFTSQSGPFSGAGGWGGVNENFLWMSYNSADSSPIDYYVTRHEVGHNFGHPHHHSNKYWYREYRPYNPEDVGGDANLANNYYDGFDMMSYGNGFEVSHLSLASKWFFNWLPSSAIVMMHPDGPTETCPGCQNKGTFILKPFDNPAIAPIGDQNVIGIHIPITAIGSSTELDYYFSYWLSYRTGVEGNAAKGLSIHLTWLSNFGGPFGASYDSLNYDAHGNTDTVFDSFVLEGTCYHISPASKMKDYDSIASNAIQPVVCVDDINIGSDITISVSFLDPNNPPISKLEVNDFSLECLLSGADFPAKSLDVSRDNLIHVFGTGKNGAIKLSNLCPDSSDATASMTAYFYDSYPYSPLSYDSPQAYGSFKSLTLTGLDCCEPDSLITAEGGTVVKVTQNDDDFLHIAEIEIYDAHGINVARDAICYSRTTGYGGDPSCLNDGNTSPTVCGSHSDWMDPENYDFCVLDTTVDIKSVSVYPYHEPGKEWMVDRLKNLRVEIFYTAVNVEDVTDPSWEMGTVSFIGKLETHTIGFSTSAMEPSQNEVILATEFSCPNIQQEGAHSITYQSEFSNTWILVVKDNGDFGKSTIDLSCKIQECGVKEVLEGDKCTTQSDQCPDGTVLAEPGSNICYVSTEFESVFEAKGWRVWATTFQTEQDWFIDIVELELYNTTDCSGSPIDPVLGSSVESGNAGSGWGAANAFDSSPYSAWGGRPDYDGLFWLGKLYTTKTSVRCLKVATEYGKGFQEMYIQAKVEEEWLNVWLEEGMVGGVTATVSLDFEPTAAPTQVEPPQFCFSGSNNVTVKGKGSISIEHLEIGDEVLGANHEYEAVYSFGHYNSTIIAEYLRISIRLPSSLTTSLEISKSHMILLANGDILPASSCRLGTNVLLLERKTGEIVFIEPVTSKGAYAPFTGSGTIVINNVLASTYVSFGDDQSGTLKIAGGSLALSFQWIAHMYETPHRMFCQGACSGETYNEDGISTWNVVPLQLTQWLLRQDKWLITLIMLPVLASLSLVSVLEMVFLSSFWLKMVIFAFCLASMKSQGMTIPVSCRPKI